MASPSTRSSTNTSRKEIEDIVDNIDRKEKSKELSLPISRIKSIMKHAEDTQNISQESIHVMTKVAELFLHHVSRGAYEAGEHSKRLEYKDVAEYVQTNAPFAFMREILPRKITFREYKDIIKKKGIIISALGSSEEGSSDESSENDTAGTDSSTAAGDSDSDSSGEESDSITIKEENVE